MMLMNYSGFGAKKNNKYCEMSIIVVFVLFFMIAINSIHVAAATKKPYLKEKTGVITVGSKKIISIENNDWYFTSTKVTSSNKKVAAVSKKYGVYNFEVMGKAEGSATFIIKIKAYRYIGSKKKKKTFKLKYKVRVYDSSPFSQYVYNDGKDVCFKYTGSGESRIIVPEGVEIIEGFAPGYGDFNNDITYVYLPSTLKKMYTTGMYCKEEYGWDTNCYNVLYQCPNLRMVEGGNHFYQCKGSSVVRPGDITVWSVNEKIPFDTQKYKNYNNHK